MNKSKQIKIGAILSYIQMGIGVVVSLVYTPMMIRILGQSEFGLYNTVASTISMLTILNLGFNSSYIRYYSKYRNNNDIDSIYRLNGLFLLIFFIIGIIAFLCGLYLTYNLELVFSNGLISTEYETAKKLMILLTFNIAISFPMSVFSNIISAQERFVFLKLLLIIKTVGSPLITLPLLLLGFGSIGVVVATLAVNIVVDFAFLLYSLVPLKQKFVFSHFDKGLFGSLFVYTSFIAINMIVDQINLNIDKVLLGRFKGTNIVAVYSVGYTLYTYYQQFSASISSLFTPRVHEIVNRTSGEERRQKSELTDLFTKVGRVQFLILGLLATGIVFFGMPFIAYWAGDGYEDAYYVLLLLVIPSTVPLIQNTGIEIQRAQNKHKFRSIVYLLMAIINLLLSIHLCQLYGAVGSAVGTAISLVVANGFAINVYYHKRCNIDILLFWKNIGHMSIGLLIPIIFGLIFSCFVHIDSVSILIVLIFFYSIVYFISVYCFSMNNEEKAFVNEPAHRFLSRIHKKQSVNND